MLLLPDPFRGMGAEKLTEIQQLGHPPRSGREINDGRSRAKTAAKEAQMKNNQTGGDPNPAVIDL